jgi:uncharacterized protein (TIGR00369 family)
MSGDLMFQREEHLLTKLGMYDVDVPAGADLAVAMPVHAKVTNPRGGLQGGLIATLADVTAGRAALAKVGGGKTVPTADLHVRYLSPVLTGPAVATARVVRQGRRSIVVQVDIRDDGRDVLAATCSAAFTILDVRPGQEEPELTGATSSGA